MEVVIKKIFGKERELYVGKRNLAFLNNEDAMELGIYCGLRLNKWEDEEYLIIISARASYLRKLKLEKGGIK